MAELTSKRLKQIIRKGIENSGKINAAYLENSLKDFQLKQKDFENIADTINETLFRNIKSQEDGKALVDDVTVKKILSHLKSTNQSQVKSGASRKSYTISPGNRVLTKLAENMRIQKI